MARLTMHVSLRWLLWLAALWLGALSSCACQQEPLPDPPPECDAEGNGCLSDERCVEGKCVLRERCEEDGDCPSAAWRCVFPSQICELRPGFDEACADTVDCAPGNFCALGRCRDLASARPCARRSDCPLGQACDRQSFVCIEEGPCTLADAYPELACDPGEVCELGSQRCSLSCQGECTPETVVADCGAGSRCDAACRCVQCLTDEDCGPGLVCNARAGRCESEDLCFEDADCEPPLVCDPRTALCQVPPPPCETDQDCEIAEICNRATGLCELPGGACVDDRFEDADTPATAEELTLAADGSSRVIDDLKLCPDDDDVFAVPLEAGDQLVARIFGTATQARATAWLLDAEGETSVRFAEAPPYGNGTVRYRAQGDETVFLRLNALLGQTPYELELVRTPGAPCGPDAFEGPLGNDTLETATAPSLVPVNATLLARVCPGDVDYLAVDLLAGEGIDAQLSFDASATDLDLALFSMSTGALLDRSAGLSAPEALRYRSPFDQTVVLRVRGFGNASGPYSLALAKHPPFDCRADTGEPDDDVAEAPLLGPGDALTGAARTLCPGDRDLYRVPLEDFERVVADATFSPSELDVELNVYDEAGETLLVTSPDSADGETVSYAPGEERTVLVEVRARFNTQGAYTLDLFRENQVSCTPDALEPNSTTADAVPPPDGGATLTICGSDQDVFAIEGVAGKALNARITFLHADGDLDLMVLGLDGDQVLAASDGVGDDEEARALLPLSGTYFVRVFSLSDDARARYHLEVALED